MRGGSPSAYHKICFFFTKKRKKHCNHTDIQTKERLVRKGCKREKPFSSLQNFRSRQSQITEKIYNFFIYNYNISLVFKKLLFIQSLTIKGVTTKTPKLWGQLKNKKNFESYVLTKAAKKFRTGHNKEDVDIFFDSRLRIPQRAKRLREAILDIHQLDLPTDLCLLIVDYEDHRKNLYMIHNVKLLPRLRNKSTLENVRGGCAEFLGKLSMKWSKIQLNNAFISLMEVLNDETNEEFIGIVAVKLDERQFNHTFEYLIGRLKSKSVNLRLSCVRALGILSEKWNAKQLDFIFQNKNGCDYFTSIIYLKELQ
ncbi:hypothetical protein RFI_03321 [Reticulomyxa filosa]|uniref:Uncharacterized protein n=1 Tax=Reticulomyxa filosa TaxID=46433 RepID=X6P5F1_RETFI|nr:hypothetical protein RFI_03321 [Reticulomyxa filosa]|eukprot:ETO33780.1 hypothetical protein RFI_03321 [Reticulomyxa filosa]